MKAELLNELLSDMTAYVDAQDRKDTRLINHISSKWWHGRGIDPLDWYRAEREIRDNKRALEALSQLVRPKA